MSERNSLDRFIPPTEKDRADFYHEALRLGGGDDFEKNKIYRALLDEPFPVNGIGEVARVGLNKLDTTTEGLPDFIFFLSVDYGAGEQLDVVAHAYFLEGIARISKIQSSLQVSEGEAIKVVAGQAMRTRIDHDLGLGVIEVGLPTAEEEELERAANLIDQAEIQGVVQLLSRLSPDMFVLLEA